MQSKSGFALPGGPLCLFTSEESMHNETKQILEAVQNGTLSVDEAVLKLKAKPFEDIGYAKVDLHRKMRQGVSEIIYGAGKTPQQICGIIETLRSNGQEQILITRLSPEAAEAVRKTQNMEYDPTARIGWIGDMQEADGIGKIVVATGGTSDIPVAEEAALTARFLKNEVVRLYDVGVAGLHRILSRLDVLMDASVVIAVAGMEGALASVLGGLTDCPVIAVPTSVGYGASFQGLSARLSMLNSCASGVSVVNIDNGFGAGYLASRINHMERK